jgi:hypothetical protein
VVSGLLGAGADPRPPDQRAAHEVAGDLHGRFDSQKELLRKLKVQKQSTLIVFKGNKEVGRSTGDTKKESIEALLAKSVGASM